ncbi:hypothetical protein HDU88_001907 [Geranomyces variabilis]|nr:hypothetical protein HDU88_001907 [Geranomyces variabilis]
MFPHPVMSFAFGPGFDQGSRQHHHFMSMPMPMPMQAAAAGFPFMFAPPSPPVPPHPPMMPFDHPHHGRHGRHGHHGERHGGHHNTRHFDHPSPQEREDFVRSQHHHRHGGRHGHGHEHGHGHGHGHGGRDDARHFGHFIPEGHDDFMPAEHHHRHGHGHGFEHHRRHAGRDDAHHFGHFTPEEREDFIRSQHHQRHGGRHGHGHGHEFMHAEHRRRHHHRDHHDDHHGHDDEQQTPKERTCLFGHVGPAERDAFISREHSRRHKHHHHDRHPHRAHADHRGNSGGPFSFGFDFLPEVARAFGFLDPTFGAGLTRPESPVSTASCSDDSDVEDRCDKRHTEERGKHCEKHRRCENKMKECRREKEHCQRGGDVDCGVFGPRGGFGGRGGCQGGHRAGHHGRHNHVCQPEHDDSSSSSETSDSSSDSDSDVSDVAPKKDKGKGRASGFPDAEQDNACDATRVPNEDKREATLDKNGRDDPLDVNNFGDFHGPFPPCVRSMFGGRGGRGAFRGCTRGGFRGGLHGPTCSELRVGFMGDSDEGCPRRGFGGRGGFGRGGFRGGSRGGFGGGGSRGGFGGGLYGPTVDVTRANGPDPFASAVTPKVEKYGDEQQVSADEKHMDERHETATAAAGNERSTRRERKLEKKDRKADRKAEKKALKAEKRAMRATETPVASDAGLFQDQELLRRQEQLREHVQARLRRQSVERDERAAARELRRLAKLDVSPAGPTDVEDNVAAAIEPVANAIFSLLGLNMNFNDIRQQAAAAAVSFQGPATSGSTSEAKSAATYDDTAPSSSRCPRHHTKNQKEHTVKEKGKGRATHHDDEKSKDTSNHDDENSDMKLAILASISSALSEAVESLRGPALAAPVVLDEETGTFLPHRNHELVAYEEALLTLLTRADEIESDGRDDVRDARKALVKKVTGELEKVDAVKKAKIAEGTAERKNKNKNDEQSEMKEVKPYTVEEPTTLHEEKTTAVETSENDMGGATSSSVQPAGKDTKPAEVTGTPSDDAQAPEPPAKDIDHKAPEAPEVPERDAATPSDEFELVDTSKPVSPASLVAEPSAYL